MSAIVKIIVNTPTASPLTEGSLAEVKKYVEEAKNVLSQTEIIANKANESADKSAQSANSAAESASSAFAAAAPLWVDDKMYNPPDVVAGTDGNSYRAIKTSMSINPVNDDGTNWKQITYNANGIITIDEDNNISPLTDTTGNIVPNDLGGNLGTNNKRWNAVYTNNIIATNITVNGQNIETLANGGRTILQRNTTYSIGEIVYSPYFTSWMYAECIQSGITGDIRPSSIYPTTEIGVEVEDGSSKWITRHIHDGHVKGEVFPMSGASFDSNGFLIHPVLNISMKDTHICDGTNDTPDLRGRFILGSSDNYKEGNIGGEETHTLNLNEIAYHTHAGNTTYSGGHIHGLYNHALTNGAYNEIQYYKISYPLTKAEGKYSAFGNPSKSVYRITEYLDFMTNEGNHNHALNINAVGGSQPHNNMPPYYTLVYVKKIK